MRGICTGTRDDSFKSRYAETCSDLCMGHPRSYLRWATAEALRNRPMVLPARVAVTNNSPQRSSDIAAR